MKIFTTNPTLFVGILAVNSVHEQLRRITDVICNDVIPFARQQRSVCDCTAASKQVNQRVTSRKIGDNPLCDFVLAATIRHTISHGRLPPFLQKKNRPEIRTVRISK